MTDDFKDLRDALRSPPAPDPAARAKAVALAMKNFDALQGSPAPPRPTPDRPSRTALNGVRAMLRTLTSRPALAATTSVAALCVGLIVTLPMLDAPLPVIPAVNVAPEPDRLLGESETTGAMPDGLVQERAEAPQPTAVAPSTAPALAPAPAPAMTKRQAVAPATRPLADAEAHAVIISNGTDDPAMQPADITEEFATAAPNPVSITAEQPVSTFSIDVDTASYSVVRSSLNAGQLPDPAAVRVEEMINYFPYAYPAPESAPGSGTEAFRATIGTMPTPWNPDTRLVHIALQGRLPAIADRPPLNLVFLIDTSGSMNEPNKLPLLKASLRLMLGQLRPEDQVAIVAYAGSAGTVLPPTAASEQGVILTALDDLAAGGSTAGAEGLALAYQVAQTMAVDGEVSRILLATDGDFNVGVSDPEGLEAYVARNRDTAYLSVIGFGRGNLDDAVMQSLAQSGNGTAAYIDTLNEAQKVLVDHLTGALFPIANDVKIQIEWNPAQVAEYRLIGYETRALAREDFNNDRIDAGEIGAGHQVTAIYEVTAPDSPALRNDPLRYGTAAATTGGDELGFLRLRSKAPGADASTLTETPIRATAATEDARFAAAIAGFGQLLTGSVYLNDWGWDQAIAMATESRGADPFGYRAEAVSLMRLAQSLSVQ